MYGLEDNWLTESPIDFEYKQYKVLNYIQKTRNHFNQFQIYPYINDVFKHVQYLSSFLKKLEELEYSRTNTIVTSGKLMMIPANVDPGFNLVKNIAEWSNIELTKLLNIAKKIFDKIWKAIEIKCIRFYSDLGSVSLDNELIWWQLFNFEDNKILEWSKETNSGKSRFDIKISHLHFENIEPLIPIIKRKFIWTLTNC